MTSITTVRTAPSTMASTTGWMTGKPANLFASPTTKGPLSSLMFRHISTFLERITEERVGAELLTVVENVRLALLVVI